MLGGEFRHNIDPKKRLFIPAKFREELGQTFVIAKDIRQKCLKVTSLAGWESYIAPLREQKRSLSERTLRYLHSTLTQVTPDSQGRIVLPQDLVDHAEILREVVVVGCYDYAEIWSEALYSKLKSEENVEELLAELEELGL